MCAVCMHCCPGVMAAILVWWQPSWCDDSHLGVMTAILVWWQPSWCDDSHLDIISHSFIHIKHIKPHTVHTSSSFLPAGNRSRSNCWFSSQLLIPVADNRSRRNWGLNSCDGNCHLRQESSLATGINSYYGNDYLRRERSLPYCTSSEKLIWDEHWMWSTHLLTKTLLEAF